MAKDEAPGRADAFLLAINADGDRACIQYSYTEIRGGHEQANVKEQLAGPLLWGGMMVRMAMSFFQPGQ